MSKETKDKLLEQLNALKIFPNNKLVRALRKQLQTKLDKVESIPTVTKVNPNIVRANKLKRYHNYIRQIRNNFPDLTYNQIRKQFAKRRS